MSVVGKAAACGVMAAVALLGLGCDGGEGGASMRPGEDCLRCHAGGEEAFTAAGTVLHTDGTGADGVTVTLTDSTSTQASATTTAVGNFYFREPLTPPFDVTITDGAATVSMQGAAGSCNSCHQVGGAAQAPIVFP